MESTPNDLVINVKPAPKSIRQEIVVKRCLFAIKKAVLRSLKNLKLNLESNGKVSITVIVSSYKSTN